MRSNPSLHAHVATAPGIQRLGALSADEPHPVKISNESAKPAAAPRHHRLTMLVPPDAREARQPALI
jgi:hypothetical protein